MNILQKRNKVPRSVWTDPIQFIACGFGVGAMPWMPGTFGTGVGVIFYLILARFSVITYLIAAVILFFIGVVICGITNRSFGTKDHSAAVFDEIVGFLFVMVAIPPRGYLILIGFVLFRVFDIWKPWPIKMIERSLPGGLGVMADDFIAAVYAWIILQFILWVF